MTATTMCHFLLIYDHRTQQLVSEQEFNDGAAATEAYTAAERRAQTDGSQEYLEIVLVGADSFETIRQTHASYFDGSVVAKSRFLVGT